MDPAWDKKMVLHLMREVAPLTFGQAMQIVGILAEERQQADREGYTRGYNNGYQDAEKKQREKP